MIKGGGKNTLFYENNWRKQFNEENVWVNNNEILVIDHHWSTQENISNKYSIK